MNTLNLEKQQVLLSGAYQTFEKGLRTHAFFRLHDQATCEDLVQETFKKTWNYLLKGGHVNLMKAFLYHVLNNLIVDEYRKRKHHSTSLNCLVEKGFELSTDDSESFFNMIDGKEAVALIKQLPETYQATMYMRYVQNLTLQEIAHNTGQTKNTVTVQSHRGLAKLKILYENR